MIKKGRKNNDTEFEEKKCEKIQKLRNVAKDNKNCIDKTNYKERKKKEVGGNRRLTLDRKQ